MTGPDAGLHALQFRLSFGECDPAGIVYYATYLEWAERVHGDWWCRRGRPIGDAGAGPSFVVRHVSCDYLAAPRANDLLGCEMSLQRVAELWLTAVFVDDDGAPCEVPDDARRLLGDVVGAR